MTEKDIQDILLKENFAKKTKLNGNKDDKRLKMLIKLGKEKLEKDLDVKYIARSFNELKQLKKLLLDKGERMLFNNQRAYLLEE